MAKEAARMVMELQADPNTNIWGIIDAWAQEMDYKLVWSDESGRIYRKGTGLWLLPRMLQATPTASGIRLEAWVKADFINRLLSLFILPPEIMIESGGKKAFIPRKKAREEVNVLLQGLGQPPIV